MARIGLQRVVGHLADGHVPEPSVLREPYCAQRQIVKEAKLQFAWAASIWLTGNLGLSGLTPNDSNRFKNYEYFLGTLGDPDVGSGFPGFTE